MRLPAFHNPLHDYGSDLLPRISRIFLILTALGALAPAWGQQPSTSAAIAAPRSPIAAGPAWSELSAVQQKILAPLGMHETAFSVPATQHGRIAEPYAHDPDGGLPMQMASSLALRLLFRSMW